MRFQKNNEEQQQQNQPAPPSRQGLKVKNVYTGLRRL